MRILVWHWGRRGAGPLFAARLAEAVNNLPGHEAVLSLSAGAELLKLEGAPVCAWAEPTYQSGPGYLAARLRSPFLRGRVAEHLRGLAPDFALCAMPALLDARMLAGLRRAGIPYGVIVHDAEAHPGDGFSFQLLEQGRALRGAARLFCLTRHVAGQLQAQGFTDVTRLWHPLIGLGAPLPPVPQGGARRLLHFGRLLPYKGLDLLEQALERLGPVPDFCLRICGEGPDSPVLARLAARPGVRVENRWFAEAELPGLLSWAEALVLPYREASQSGVAAMALGAGRKVLATNVGGLPEQLGGAPGAALCAPEAGAIAAGLADLLAGLRTEPALAPPGPDWRALAEKMLAALGG